MHCRLVSSFREPRTTYEGADDALVESFAQRRAGISRGDFVAVATRAGETLKDKYAAGEVLGEGATATVHRAKNLRTGQTVALKAIDKKLLDVKMQQNEIMIHKATDHPNILRLLETFEDENFYFLVAELCEGGDLKGFLEAVGTDYSVLKMQEDEALSLFLQVLASVRYLHLHGIVHRDLKPANFLCAASSLQASSGPQRASMIIKLADFGVSANCRSKHRLVKRVGTEGFMAPEVAKCLPYNEKADIFSIGCILHAMLTGKPPRIVDGAVRLDKLRLRYVSEDMRSLISTLTEARPDDRPGIEEIVRVPIINAARQRMQAESPKLSGHLFDKICAYGSFPLLKKAAIVAMVSRAESDAEFLPLVQKFMAFGPKSSLNFAIGVHDLYGALSKELMSDSAAKVMLTLGVRARRRIPRHRAKPLDGPATKVFQNMLLREVRQIVDKVDGNRTGVINYTEWLACTVDAEWYLDPQKVTATFRLFDFDQDGIISEDDLKTVIPMVAAGVDVDKMLKESQLAGVATARITEEHFALLLRTQNPSAFTLGRISRGIRDPLCVSKARIDEEMPCF